MQSDSQTSEWYRYFNNDVPVKKTPPGADFTQSRVVLFVCKPAVFFTAAAVFLFYYDIYNLVRHVDLFYDILALRQRCDSLVRICDCKCVLLRAAVRDNDRGL